MIIEKLGVGPSFHDVNASAVRIATDEMLRFAHVGNTRNKVAITTGTRFVDSDASIRPSFWSACPFLPRQRDVRVLLLRTGSRSVGVHEPGETIS